MDSVSSLLIILKLRQRALELIINLFCSSLFLVKFLISMCWKVNILYKIESDEFSKNIDSITRKAVEVGLP